MTMIMTRFELFVALFNVMSKGYFAGYDSDELVYYVGDANPFAFVDEGSLDPVVYEDFKDDFKQVFPEGVTDIENARYFGREWFKREMEREEVYRGNLLEVFDKFATEEAWSSIVKESIAEVKLKKDF